MRKLRSLFNRIRTVHVPIDVLASNLPNKPIKRKTCTITGQEVNLHTDAHVKDKEGRLYLVNALKDKRRFKL